MKSSRPLRRKRGAKRLDLTDIRHVLHDKRIWTSIAVVTQPDDGSKHWRIETNDAGVEVDILVSVVLEPDGIPVEARLAGGMWIVPSVGEEVAVLVPSGRVDFMPTIVAILSSNDVPPSSSNQGPSTGRTVIARAEVLVHDGSGGAAELALKSDVDDLRNYIANDLTLPVSGSTAGPVATPSPPTATGTTVLKAK